MAAVPSVTFHHGAFDRVVQMWAGYLLDEPSGAVSTSRGTQHTDMSYTYMERGGGAETFQDRAARCSHQAGVYGPGSTGDRNSYVGGCINQ